MRHPLHPVSKTTKPGREACNLFAALSTYPPFGSCRIILAVEDVRYKCVPGIAWNFSAIIKIIVWIRRLWLQIKVEPKDVEWIKNLCRPIVDCYSLRRLVALSRIKHEKPVRRQRDLRHNNPMCTFAS